MSTPRGPHKRRRLGFRRQTAPGAAPGTVAHDPNAPVPVIRVFGYGPDEAAEQTGADLAAVAEASARWPIVWVDVQGLGDAETIRKLGELFGLHPLAMEDVVNTHQRPKVEDYGEHLFIVVRMPIAGQRLDTEQVSVFLGKNFVLTFQERPGDCLESVRKRIGDEKGRLRRGGTDCLAHALLDAVVDAYFPLLEQYGEAIDEADEELSRAASRETSERIHGLRGDLLQLRRAIWPFRDALAGLARDPNPLISDETRVYLRDCYDHTVQIIDLTETCRELCSDLRDYYLSTISNRMNEVMKVLTVIATVFIPLTFIAGVYGMNFDPGVSRWNMPELRWPFGYPMVLGLMAVVTGGLLAFFWRRGWLR